MPVADPSRSAPNGRLRELTQEKLHLVREARDILDAAEEEGRDLSQEEQNRWDDLNGEIDTIDGAKHSRYTGNNAATKSAVFSPTNSGKPPARYVK